MMLDMLGDEPLHPKIQIRMATACWPVNENLSIHPLGPDILVAVLGPKLSFRQAHARQRSPLKTLR